MAADTKDDRDKNDAKAITIADDQKNSIEAEMNYIMRVMEVSKELKNGKNCEEDLKEWKLTNEEVHRQAEELRDDLEIIVKKKTNPEEYRIDENMKKQYERISRNVVTLKAMEKLCDDFGTLEEENLINLEDSFNLITRQKNNSQRKVAKNTSYNGNESTKVDERTDEEIESEIKYRKENRRTIRCETCGKTGHKTDDCIKGICYYCGGVKHTRTNCPNDRRGNTTIEREKKEEMSWAARFNMVRKNEETERKIWDPMIELRYEYVGNDDRGPRPTMDEVVSMVEAYGGKFEGIKAVQIDYRLATVVMNEPKFMEMVGIEQKD